MAENHGANHGVHHDDAIERVETGRAWNDFCELLRDAGAILQRDDLGLDTFDRAEGLRYLSRLTQNGLSSFLENPGPRHPAFRALPEHCGFGLDNPDNVYASAGINPALDYRIAGNRGTISYLSLAAQNQNYARRDRITGGAGHLDHHDLAIAPDGSFEVVASQREHPGNWLRLAPDSSMILVRQTLADRAREVAADLRIECIGVTDPPGPLEPAPVPDWSEARPPHCDYWNFQLGNIWAECLDKRRTISRNIASTTSEPDGSFRLVVALTDPGHPNWIDTCGHRHGIMGLRWVRADAHPPATTQVVPLVSLA